MTESFQKVRSQGARRPPHLCLHPFSSLIIVAKAVLRVDLREELVRYQRTCRKSRCSGHRVLTTQWPPRFSACLCNMATERVLPWHASGEHSGCVDLVGKTVWTRRIRVRINLISLDLRVATASQARCTFAGQTVWHTMKFLPRCRFVVWVATETISWLLLKQLSSIDVARYKQRTRTTNGGREHMVLPFFPYKSGLLMQYVLPT